MPDETESAVAAWLDNPTTQREITIARRRLAKAGGDPAPFLMALLVEILANLNVYGEPETDEFPDTGADEPWRTP